MNVFIFKHEGVYPVGACSVVTAESELLAREALMGLLAERGLDDETLIELVWRSGQLDRIILDGDY